MAVLIGEAPEVARGQEGQMWVGWMVWVHRVLRTPRTEVSVCERETIRKRKTQLLGSEIVTCTELEVSQFILKSFGKPHMGCVGGRRGFCMARFREVRAQLGDRVAQK